MYMCVAFGVNRSFSARRGLQYLRHAATQQTIMDGQCSIDMARFEIMTRIVKDVYHDERSLNDQIDRIRPKNQHEMRVPARLGLFLCDRFSISRI